MSLPSLLLVGAGGHARACIDVIEMEGRFAIAGLVGSAAEVGTSVLGYRVIATDAELSGLAAQIDHALVVVGQIKSASPRISLFESVRAAGFKTPTIVSPIAHVSRHASVGEGTIVMHGAIVNAAASVGRNCIINTQALIEHDATIGDHCHVSTNAAVNSGVRVGAGTFIGSGSSIRQGITIGANCLIGLGERVRTDCADGQWLAHRSAP